MKRFLLPAAMLAAFAGHAAAETLTFWAPATFTPGAPVAAVGKTYADLIAEFEAANPGVKVNYEILPGAADAIQQILTAANGDNLPDFANLDGFWIARVLQTGKLQTLNDIWSEADRARFDPAVIDAVTFDDKIYALWFYNAFRGVFYRKDVLDQLEIERAPSNWAEFEVFAEKAKTAGYPSAVLYPGKTETATFQPMLSMFWGLGGELIDNTGKPVFMEGKNREALERVYAFYKEMVDKGYLRADFVTMGEYDVRSYFYAGDTPALVTTSSFVEQMYADQPSLRDNLVVGEYPMPDARPVPVTVGFTWGVFAQDPARRELSWKFIEFMTGTDALSRTLAASGRVPVTTDVWESDAFKSNELYQQFRDLLSGGKPRPPFPIYPITDNAISSNLAEVISGALTPAQAVDAAAETVMADYERLR